MPWSLIIMLQSSAIDTMAQSSAIVSTYHTMAELWVNTSMAELWSIHDETAQRSTVVSGMIGIIPGMNCPKTCKKYHGWIWV